MFKISVWLNNCTGKVVILYTKLHMKNYKENDMVIYTDAEGKQYDTFVIFDTDRTTGLTHINHLNLKVSLDELELHPRSANGCTLPMEDTYSFELFRQLKEKFIKMDEAKLSPAMKVYRETPTIQLAKAS